MEKCTHETLFSSVEELVRSHVRTFVEEVVEDEVSRALARIPYGRGGLGYRNGHRERTLLTTFGPMTLNLPRARLPGSDGKTVEFRSSVVPKSRQMSQAVESLIVASYLCGVSARKCETALAEALGPGVSKSTVSRCLQNLKPDWEAWKKRDLSRDGIERLILDGLVVPVRLGGRSEKIHVLVALGVKGDGRKVALCFHEMGSESKESWKELLEDLAARGVKSPGIVVTDGSKGLEAALAEIWPKAPQQRCTVHKERNLLAHAPESRHEEIKAEYQAMMYAETPEEAIAKRGAFLVKWKKECPAVARSLEEAGDRLFTFLRFPPSQWRSLRTTNAIERLNEELRRRVKVQGLQPSGESVCMLFWALLASGVVTMRKVDGWESLHQAPKEELSLAA